jgi:hypothetical protein
VTQAQTASRISALGQEEKLAAAGLSSGSSSAAPTSGYTESARVASDNNLRSNLNALSLSKMQQEQDAREASTSEMLQAQSDYYNSLTDIGLQKAQSTIDQYNADRTYETTAKNTAYEQAMQRWETYGVVLPADAAILGVAAGTRTASSTYQQAQTSYNESKIKIDQEELKIEREKLALERWKALL